MADDYVKRRKDSDSDEYQKGKKDLDEVAKYFKQDDESIDVSFKVYDYSLLS